MYSSVSLYDCRMTDRMLQKIHIFAPLIRANIT